MAQIQFGAEMIYSKEGGYNRAGREHPELASFCNNIFDQIKTNPIIYSSSDAYCSYLKLPSGRYFCLDSKMNIGQNSVYPGQKGYCDGITFVCPKTQ